MFFGLIIYYCLQVHPGYGFLSENGKFVAMLVSITYPLECQPCRKFIRDKSSVISSEIINSAKGGGLKIKE